ncbi:hypothetical protein ES708_27273 [subsurface metagenome]
MAEPPIPNTTIFLKLWAGVEVKAVGIAESSTGVGVGKKSVGIVNFSPKRKASLIFSGNSSNSSIMLA